MNIFDELVKVKNIRKKIFFVLLFFILSYLYLNFLLAPLQSQTKSLTNKIYDIRVKNTLGTKKSSKQKENYNRYIETQEEFKSLQDLSFSYSENESVFETIDKILKEEELTLINFEPQKEMKQESHTSCFYRLTLKGEYIGIKNFIKKISRLKKIINIEKLNMHNTSTETAIECFITFTIYKMKHIE